MTHAAIRHLDAAEALLDQLNLDIGPDTLLIRTRVFLARVREECVRSAIKGDENERND